MDDKKPTWRQFRRLKFDSKDLTKRARRAEGVTTRHARKFILRRLDSVREVKRHIVLWLVVIGCLIVTAGVQLIWFQKSYTTVASTEGGTYAEGVVGAIDTMNPLYASTVAELAVSKLVFSSLYDYDKSGHLRESVATSIDARKQGDNYVYTVTINPAVRWHDGVRLTASDIAFTINLIKDPETRSRLRTSWQDINVKVVDDRTMQFILPAAYASFTHALTFSILPEHLLKDIAPGLLRESVFSLQPVGSGPFQFRRLQTVSKEAPLYKIASLESFDDYYRGAPKLNRFEVHAFDSSEAIAEALRTGQINAAIGSADAALFTADTNFEVSSHPLNSGVYALLNTERPALEDIEVRRALQLSSNPKAIRDKFVVTPPTLDLPFIEGQVSEDMPSARPYNPKKAAKLLDKAGWKLVDGVRTKKKEKLTLEVVTIKNSGYEKSLEQLAGEWRKLGINVQTNVIDVDDPAQNFVQNILQPRSYDVLIYELTIGADPDVFAYWHSSQRGANELNLSNYSNALADDALVSARLRDESRLRDLKYKTFAKRWLADVPAIGLYQSTMTYVHSKSVQSIADDQEFIDPVNRYIDVLYWTVGQKSVYNTP